MLDNRHASDLVTSIMVTKGVVQIAANDVAYLGSREVPRDSVHIAEVLNNEDLC